MLPDPHRRDFLATAGAVGLGLAAGQPARGDDPPLAPPDKQPPDLKVPEAPPKTVGWAVVGLGKLALEEVMPAFQKCKLSKPVALVSGHPDKAKKVAAAYGIDPKNIYDYQTFDKLAENPAVQVVYVILPNSMHAEYTVRAHKAGKHVLCEKPMAPTSAECEQMIAAGKEAKRKLMVAYRLRYEPFNQYAIAQCQTKAIGKLKGIVATNGQDTRAPNIRLSKDLKGGPLPDVGIYCLNAARYLTGEEPVEVTAMAHQPKDDPRFREVPESVFFTLRFPGGTIANCDCSFGVAETRHFRVEGAAGRIDLENAFAYRGQRLFVDAGGRRSEVKFQPVDHFQAEMEHFSECVLNDQPPRTPGEEGLADLRAIEAIEEAARTGKVVKVRA